MNLFVRPYLPSDFQRCLNFDGRASKIREYKLKRLELSEIYYGFVAEFNGEIVGFIVMEDRGDGISHYMVQVNVKEKRQKIGTRLVVRVFETVKVGGHISLCVNTDNEVAIRFYESLGFKWAGYTRGYKKGQNKFWYEIDIR